MTVIASPDVGSSANGSEELRREMPLPSGDSICVAV